MNDVEKYRDGIFKVSENQLGDLDEGEFYYHEIIGCTVVTTRRHRNWKSYGYFGNRRK